MRDTRASLDNRRVSDLITEGMRSNLDYAAATSLEAAPEIDRKKPCRSPTQNAARVLEMWGVPDASNRAAELLDPAWVRMTLLDAIWELWLDQAWRELWLSADVSPTVASSAGYTGSPWISLVTGHQQ